MKIDDSFKKPGSVPFKWEIRPGVPKLQSPPPQNPVQQKPSPVPETPKKLRPPPARLHYQPRTGSSPRTFSRRIGNPGLAQPDVVSSAGCFPSPGKPKNVKKDPSPISVPEPEYYSDLETSSRWSVSSRKSVSPLSSTFASHQSSPRPVGDAEWAGFGLF